MENLDNNEYYTLTFNHLGEMVSNELVQNVKDIYLSNIDKPWIVRAITVGLSDTNPFLRMYTRDSIIKMIKLLSKLNTSMFQNFFDISSGDIDPEKLLKYTSYDCYKIEATNGLRIATQNEVDEAIYQYFGDKVIKLINEPIMALDNKELTFFNTFTWAVTGYWRYYIKAGFECSYNGNSLKEPEINYIMKISNVLFRMCQLLDEGYCNTIIDKIKHIKRLGKYSYPKYAEDEVYPDEKFVFVFNQIKKIMPYKKNSEQMKVLSIIKRNRNMNINSYSTEDKLFIREVYCNIKYNKDTKENEYDASKVIEIKNLCDIVIQGTTDGFISSNEFVFKIIETLKKNGYRKCSDKQKSIIIEAINKINTAKKSKEQIEAINKVVAENKGDTSEINADSDSFNIAGMSDLLGKGIMLDE